MSTPLLALLNQGISLPSSPSCYGIKPDFFGHAEE
jgi:hypothetical protein